jgi:hypothetical protein
MGSPAAGAGGSGSGFFEPVAGELVGMGSRPAAGQHGFQARGPRTEPEQKIADLRPGLNSMPLPRSRNLTWRTEPSRERRLRDAPERAPD